MAGASSISSNTSPGKRKRGLPKFYAVKVGRTPGIYHSWDDCKAQTDGVHSEYKSFSTLTEAEAYIRGSTPACSKSSKPTKFYGVAIGHAPGVYTDYASVQAQVKGFAGAKQKGFGTLEEAHAYVDSFKRDPSLPISLRGDLSETSSLAAGKGCKVGDGSAKRRRKNEETPAVPSGDIQWEPGTGPFPPGAEDGFDPSIKLDADTGTIRLKTAEELSLTTSQPTGDFSGPVNVYTDGSSLGNGQYGALAGVGVYFGPSDPRNVSEPLRGAKQTNQRAELTAVARALDHVPLDRDIIIHTDSKYSINCLTEWFQKWEKNGWKSASGKAVDNKDLIEPIIARIRERELCRAKTKLNWVRGHASSAGNIAADRLAVQGSHDSTPAFRDGLETSSTLNATRPSEPVEVRLKDAGRDGSEEKDEEAAEMEGLFADLAAEQTANRRPDEVAASPKSVPFPIAASTLARAGAKEGQEQLRRVVHGQPLPSAAGDQEIEAINVAPDRTST